MGKPGSRWRIATYNILEGGEGRRDPIAETLAVIDADVVAVIEANDVDAIEYFARKLGYEYAMAESPTTRFHVALLSRPPIVEAVNLGVRHEHLSRAAMRARVRTPAGELQLLVMHLDSGLGAESEATRLAEVQTLLGAIDTRVAPTVIAGDLNTNAPYHAVDVAAATADVQRQLHADPHLIRHDVVGHLASLGWIDALHAARPDETVHTFTTASPSTRLDYIFVDAGSGGRVADAGVEQRGFAPYCSDHFPLWVDLTLNRPA